MRGTSTSIERPPVNSTPGAFKTGSLHHRIAAIAELGARALDAHRCVIASQPGASGADEVVRAPATDASHDAIVDALLAALSNRLTQRPSKPAGSATPSESLEVIALTPAEIAAIARTGEIGSRRMPAAAAFSDGSNTVRIAIVAPSASTRDELNASIELIARAVLSELCLSSARASLEFWRGHGAERSRQAALVQRDLLRERGAEKHLAAAVTAARLARPAERFNRLGQLVAAGAGFDQWIVAVADGPVLNIAALSPGLETFEPARPASALAHSFSRRIVISRPGRLRAGNAFSLHKYPEDKILDGSYVCLPFDDGAIALASRSGRGSVETAQAIIDRLAPLVSTWIMERELSRRDGLVRRLALRMFTAIDEERARIARDLHDDQAQMLAAVKIALEGRHDAARVIFEQVERELRDKTRALRPATLGNASLHEAIESEFARLGPAGIRPKLLQAGAVEKISRPVEQLCFQVVREALSNVIRHARAKSVEVTIEKIDAAARVSVIDDGRGFDGHNAGAGMAGMRERLELMGGSLKIESRAGGTTVIAQIPEFS